MNEPLTIRMSGKEVLPLFPTLVFKSQLSPESFEPLNRKILARLDELTADEPPLDPGGMWQTDQRFHEAEGMEDLERIIRGSCTGVLDSMKVAYESFDITGCWANISGPAAPHKMHTHPNNYLSGVYYVKTQDRANSIFFHDPRPQITIISPPPLEVGPATAGKIRVQADPGALIVFPSWLQHSVEPNQSPENRVSIAFNIMFTSYVEQMSPPRWEGNVSLEN
jgi:uncharacterized protein (TIGR02466 family)